MEKSLSEKVQLAKFKAPITGIQIAGKKVINKPCKNEPTKQPFIPPSALAKTPAVAPQKKWGTTPGRINATGINVLSIIPSATSPIIPPKKDTKKNAQ